MWHNSITAGVRDYSPLGEQLTVGAQVFENRSDDDLERFLLSIRFEHQEKIYWLVVEFWIFLHKGVRTA